VASLPALYSLKSFSYGKQSLEAVPFLWKGFFILIISCLNYFRLVFTSAQRLGIEVKSPNLGLALLFFL
jgi:hypothetical protein